MKSSIILCILAISYCSFGQPIKGVDFDEATPYDELNASDFMNLKGLFVKDAEGDYLWLWNVTPVGYARSLEKIRDLLEVNEYGLTPDRDRSIIPNSVRDVFSEYNAMVNYCEMEEAEVLMYWYFNEDWVLGWTVNNLIAAAALIPMSEELERHRPSESERQQLVKEQQQQAERLNNLGADAFGNQGDPSGSPDADRYSTGGGLGDGISYGGLGSRRGNVPKPNTSGCEVTQKIEIRVDIQVDKEGRVISASVGQATYQDQCIWEAVIDAAKRSTFSSDQSSNYRQTGWIKYIIVP